MTAKFGEARRRAFLLALEATGNQTLAAERAKVSRSWVTLHRSGDAAFRRAMDQAVAAAKERLVLRQAQDARPGCKPPTGWGYLDGEELVVKGAGGSALRDAAGAAPQDDPSTGSGRARRRVQIARARIKQWSPRVEKRFLETLSATCNVKAACAEVGLTPASAYAHKKRWQGFADRWKQALEDGYTQLEAGLIFAAGNFLSGEPEVGPITGVTMTHALEIWEARERQKKAQSARRRSRNWWVREPSIEEVRAELLRKVEAIKRHDPERLRRARKEWAKRRPASGA